MKAAVRKPCSASTSASMWFSSGTRNPLRATPWVCGQVPVMSEVCAASVVEAALAVFVKRTPSAASASMRGEVSRS